MGSIPQDRIFGFSSVGLPISPFQGCPDPFGQVLKVSPLFKWERSEVWAYIQENNVPYNKLHEQGFPTVGCTHCTAAVPGLKLGEYSREGRWKDQEKTECGLHGGAGI